MWNVNGVTGRLQEGGGGREVDREGDGAHTMEVSVFMCLASLLRTCQ